MKTVQEKIPKLRFPGFSDGWEEKKLGDMSFKVGSGSTPRGGSAVYRTSGVPFIRSQNVTGGKLKMDEVVYIDELTHQSMLNSAMQPRDVLLNITGASLGRTCVVPRGFKEGNLNQHVCIIRLKSGYEPYLAHTILSKPKSLHNLLKTQTGGGKEGLNFQAVRSFKLTLPDKDEQEKIAGFLTVVDERIELMEKKLELSKKYKKGLMQKLFPQKGHTNPTLRFKKDDDSDFPDWHSFKIGNSFKFIGNNSLSRDMLSYEDGVIHNIHYGDIHTKFQSHFDLNRENTPKIKAANSEFESLTRGDLVIADASEDYADTGKAIEIIDLHGETVVAGLHTIVLRSDGLKLATGFLGHVFSSAMVRTMLKRIAQGAKVLGISKKYLSELHVMMPSILEQQKIADFLSGIDAKIEEQERKLEQAKQFKKALLQQMFV